MIRENVNIRYATKMDIDSILALIHNLAVYEKLENEVVATKELLEEWLFIKKKAEVLILEENDIAIGYALFFHNFSTFLGRAGIYLEDLYIKESYRNKGYGKALLQTLAKITMDRGCGRLEWSCLDWNISSIEFYKSLGAKPMNGWTTFRLTGEKLNSIAKKQK